ncbi:HI0074 family nucleotidyltransferase substrate-binding subunit [Limibacterium fermenti]|jgi:nucleotidyltransferase substrate binding protein (TIGR01987 family)|uniref:HI0074 family nucleotidyltransferase substrate-binding subunit n=1 Tax=Limibacterium fermenti TaxID=3229863 RepID=UPI000E9D27E1|nr:nucleotidyltransferase [Porphyromonadaceae bacterium]HBX20882.1 nucleotidyltransferase [Porphyromonadaceae bacterium]HBX47049.1 nucleotidyltransferase [Porphyromonadaceae bacterium]HCM21050.1 nucleotidyltransferase [Porphyromonadaceae bacterium]
MDDRDIRWKQRFRNFERAFLRLEEALYQQELNELERNGLLQRFEFTIELAWKVTKDFLEEKGFTFKPSPKDTFRQAQEAKYIDYAQPLIDGLDIRNELSHDYDGELFRLAEIELRNDIFPAITQLYQFFESEYEGS